MYHAAVVRALVLTLAVTLQQLLSPITFISILIALTFSHYTFSLYFARKRLHRLTHTSSKVRASWSLLIFAVLFTSFYDWPPMILLFGVHHIFNEVILSERRNFGSNSISRPLQLSRYALESLVYLSIVVNDFKAHGWPDLSLVFGIGLLIAAGVYLLNVVKTENWKADLPFLGAGVAIAAYCLVTTSGGLDVALYYHFTYWALAPLSQLTAQGNRQLTTYCVLTLGSVLAVLPFTPLMLHLGELSLDTLSRMTRIGGYFHIISSFALSSAHPQFVRSLFESLPKENYEETRFKKSA